MPASPGQLGYAAAEATQVRWSEGQRYSPAAQTPQPVPFVMVQEPPSAPGQSENSPRHSAYDGNFAEGEDEDDDDEEDGDEASEDAGRAATAARQPSFMWNASG